MTDRPVAGQQDELERFQPSLVELGDSGSEDAAAGFIAVRCALAVSRQPVLGFLLSHAASRSSHTTARNPGSRGKCLGRCACGAPDTSRKASEDSGGERAAAIDSLIGTAKLNGLDPEAYLRQVLQGIADHPINSIEELLPWNILAVEAPVS